MLDKTSSLLNAAHSLSCSSPALPSLGSRPLLHPVRITGSEALNSVYEYKVILKTPDDPSFIGAALYELDKFKLSSLIGRELSIKIQLEGIGQSLNIGAGERRINGIITDAVFVRAQHRTRFYQLSIKPWIHLLDLNADCRIFQNINVIEIFDTIFSEAGFPVEKRLNADYPKRSYTTQFNESSFAFFARLAEEWGIAWFFVHEGEAHRLVLADNMGSWQQNPSSAYQNIAYFPPETARIDEEYLDYFAPAEHLVSGQYATTEYDYTRPNASLLQTKADPVDGVAHNDIEVFNWHGETANSAHFAQPEDGAGHATNDPWQEGGLIADLRMAALKAKHRTAKASGALRGLLTGCYFSLERHPDSACNQDWLVLASHLDIEDNGESSIGKDSLRADDADLSLTGVFSLRVKLDLHPMSSYYVPAITRSKPRSHGPIVAKVVGESGSNIWVDNYGRIKVKFPFIRNKIEDETSSCWVRVSSPWAGGELGSIQIPRIGEEVIIDFLGGSLDLPICVGRVFNHNNMPPFELPSQMALSGFRSRELVDAGGNSAEGRSNHLILDDTKEQIQAVLASDHAGSQLNLGFLTHIPGHKGRTDKSGEGFALRTDDWGSIRSGKGLHLSSWLKPANSGTHMDSSEALQQLQEANQQIKEHSQLSVQQQAAALDAQQSNIDLRTALTGESTKEFKQPVISLSSPKGIISSTPESTHLVSAKNNSLTSGQHINLSAGKSLVATVVDKISLFAQKLGMALIAMHGDIVIYAQSDNIIIKAKKKITLQADEIEILAHTKTTVNGGGSNEVLNQSSYTHNTNGTWTAHAAKHVLAGPLNMPFDMKNDMVHDVNTLLPRSRMKQNDEPTKIRVVPNIQLPKQGIFSYIEKTNGSKFNKADQVIIANQEVLDKWVAQDGRIYFISNELTIPADKVIVDGKDFLLEKDVRPFQTDKEFIDSMVKQMDILNKAGELHKDMFGDKHELDRVMDEGISRYYYMLNNIEQMNLPIKSQQYLVEQIEKVKNKY